MNETTSIRPYFALLFLALIFSTGCKLVSQPSAANQASAEQKASSSDSDLPKFMTADISGDYTEHFSAKDGVHGTVGIGALGSLKKGTARFEIGASNEGPDHTIDLTTGFLVQFSGFSVGTPQDAVGADVKISQGENAMDYSDQLYFPYYQTRADNPPVAHVTFSKADKLSSGNSLLVRYHLVGTFDFQAVYVPQMSEACAQEAVAHSPRHPMYKPDLCGAKKVAVKGSFDITEDLPTSFFE